MKSGIFKTVHVLAAMIGRKMGVDVKIGGTSCCTNGKTIYLPSLPMDSNEAKVRAIGQVDHEALHVAETSFDVEICPLVNIFEDGRIEDIGMRQYPGMRQNLEDLVELIVQDDDGFIKLSESNDVSPLGIVAGYLLYHLRYKWLKQPALEEFYEDAVKVIADTLSPEALTAINAVLADAPDMESTQDAKKLADRVRDILKEEDENKPQPEEDDEDKDNESNSDNADSNSDNESGESSSSNESNSDKDASEQAADSQNGTEGDDSDSASNAQSVKRFDVDSMDDDLEWTDIGKANAKALGEIYEEIKAEAENDSNTMPPVMSAVIEHEDAGRIINQAEANQISNGLRHKLQSKLQTMVRKRGNPKKTGVHGIEGHFLGTMFAGNTNVFKSKPRKVALDTHIHLLIDGSSSMHMDGIARDEVAAKSAYAIVRALDSIKGITTEVTRFETSKTGRQANVIVLKKHSESARNMRPTARAYGSTPMTESLIAIAPLLAAKKEKRKLLIVITDGAPNDHTSAKEVIKKYSRSGVDVVGLGIQSDAGAHIFDQWSSIQSLSDLPKSLFSLIERKIM